MNAPKPDPLEDYHRISETIGGVPSLRLKDNVIQAICVGVGTLLGAAVGSILALTNTLGIPLHWGAILGAVVGLILATFLSGLVLMILGWVRVAQRKKTPGGVNPRSPSLPPTPPTPPARD